VKALDVWPDALVVRLEEDGHARFLLQRPGHEHLVLGADFGDAHRALLAAIRIRKGGGTNWG
jgi:hypothetical protein